MSQPFTAWVLSRLDEDGALTVGLADAEPPTRYLLLQRATGPLAMGEEQDEIHIEYDELHSGYGGRNDVSSSKCSSHSTFLKTA